MIQVFGVEHQAWMPAKFHLRTQQNRSDGSGKGSASTP
jgi:hypothetical protein